MAGRPREPGPASRRVAENLRRLRGGLSYAELSRRLARTGHHILDTGLLKIEKGERRVDVDDLTALAIALGTTPNRLLLPLAGIEHEAEAGQLAPGTASTPGMAWAWAAGEVPLGRQPARATDGRQARSEEVAFSRENRPQHWAGPQHWTRAEGEPPLSGRHVLAVAGINAFIAEAVRLLFSTGEIRGIVEGAIASALLAPDPAAGPSRIEAGEDGKVIVYLHIRDLSEGGGA